ncbi:hypothetical protein ES708_22162 [subsurface metagenome]
MEESPYLPPVILGVFLKGAIPSDIPSCIAVTISVYNGSPTLPGSLVRSKAAIVFTVLGRELIKCLMENGR